jgi:hypothetical protein
VGAAGTAGVTRAIGAAVIVVTLLVAAACGLACAPRTDRGAAPLLAGAPSDVVVVLDAKRAGGRTSLDWVNFVTRAVGPVRVVGAGAPAESLASARVLIVPAASALDRALAERARAVADVGGVVLVDASEAAEPMWPGEGALFVEGEHADDALLTFINRATPLPRLAPHPAGHGATHVPAIHGPSGALAAAAEAAAASDVTPTALVASPDAFVDDLERMRRAGAAIGSWLGGAASGGGRERGIEGTAAPRTRARGLDWPAWRAARAALARLGAGPEEIATAGAPALLAADDAARLAADSVTVVAAPRGGAWPSSDAAPFQASGAGGAPASVLVFPTDTAAVASPGDTAWIAAAVAARAAGAWDTRLDAAARFWQSRARTPLTSTWDGTRLGIRAEPAADGLALLVPATAAGKTLREILWNGATTQGEAVDAPGGPCVRLRLPAGASTLWALYE